jgi:GNAT superfamily N-acetyltransferase
MRAPCVRIRLQLCDEVPEVLKIEPITGLNRDKAVMLLLRFFQEEGFSTPGDKLALNFSHMMADKNCWAALAMEGGRAEGVVTVTTMLYAEWGRLGEIGDLYVLPERRGRGVARRLVDEAILWCRKNGCSAVSVVVTPEGEVRHRLSEFYRNLAFEATGRTIMSKLLL